MLRVSRAVAGLVAAVALLGASPSTAQGLDPRQALAVLISAFQQCGPPQAYQLLSPQLFQIVAQQTGGMGCYPAIAAAGPVLGMQLVDQKQLPGGMVYVIRVTHQAGSVDWFIGIGQASGKVELLTFQAATATPPTVATGPRPDAGGTPPPPPPPGSSPEGRDGCDLYPSMC